MMQTRNPRPKAITLIAVVNGVAAVLHGLFWVAVLLELRGGQEALQLDAGAVATIYGFGVADLVWSAPLLALSAVGLWRGRLWGWLAAQWCNVLYGYSLTVVWVRDLTLGTVSPGGVLFLPFTLFAFWAAWHLWFHRADFTG